MPRKISSAARYLFVSTLITGGIVAGLEAAAPERERLGVHSCGWEGNPCELAPLVVKAQRAPRDATAELIAQR